jgi:selenide,water dikinase
VLRKILENFPAQVDPNLLVGHGGADDAGVYRIDDERALVLTVDFFTPVVDDPYDYGQIAAVNSLSDVYAMGARPLVALNIAAFPEAGLPAEVMGEVFHGAASVAKDAGIVIAGGHTVTDNEVKFGLSVVGVVDPKHIIQNAGARPGDELILTKPIGTGTLSTALKAGELPDELYHPMVSTMTQLNRFASEQMQECGVSACTDITGNGLLGHAFEMAEASKVTIEIHAAAVPVLPGALDMIARGHMPGGTAKNRHLVGDAVEWANHDVSLDNLLFDPQTSGGLLIALSPGKCEGLLESIQEVYPEATIVGKVVEREKPALRVV